MLLLKIFDEADYAEDFVNGHIRVMPVSTYKKDTVDKARRDVKESTITPVVIKPDLNVPIQPLDYPGATMCLGIKALQEDLEASGDKLSVDDLLIAALPLDPYVLCMSYVGHDQNEATAFLTNLTDIFSDEQKGSFGVLVRGDDLVSHIRCAQKKHPILRDMLSGPISYIEEDAQPNNVFEKPQSFIYEHEYRFVFPHIAKESEERPDYFIDIEPLPGTIFSISNNDLHIIRNTFVQ